MTVFPKVDGPSGRGLRQPPGLSPLGCQGSACERLRLTGSLRASPRELYSTALCVSRMGYASQPKLASSLHNKRLSNWRLTGFGRNDNKAEGVFVSICSLQTYDKASASKLSNYPVRNQSFFHSPAGGDGG